MAQATFGSVPVIQGQTITLAQAQQDLRIDWQADPNRLYTVIMFDMSVPNPPLVHFLVVNVPGNDVVRGDVVLSYLPPHPPSGTHEYYIDVFAQNNRIEGIISTLRENADIKGIVDALGLIPVGRGMFKVSSSAMKVSEQEAKYCDCVLDVQHKGNVNNPYAVCAKSVGTTYGKCSEDVYDFQNMPLSKLQDYAALHNLPTDGSREDLIRRIEERKTYSSKSWNSSPASSQSSPATLPMGSSPSGNQFDMFSQQMKNTFSDLGNQFNKFVGQLTA